MSKFGVQDEGVKYGGIRSVGYGWKSERSQMNGAQEERNGGSCNMANCPIAQLLNFRFPICPVTEQQPLRYSLVDNSPAKGFSRSVAVSSSKNAVLYRVWLRLVAYPHLLK